MNFNKLEKLHKEKKEAIFEFVLSFIVCAVLFAGLIIAIIHKDISFTAFSGICLGIYISMIVFHINNINKLNKQIREETDKIMREAEAKAKKIIDDMWDELDKLVKAEMKRNEETKPKRKYTKKTTKGNKKEK